MSVRGTRAGAQACKSERTVCRRTRGARRSDDAASLEGGEIQGRLRAALYRVIAHLPGVQLLGWQTDRIGRRGIAVAISHAEVGDEATCKELLFDPTTGEPLQTQLVQTAPLTEIPGAAPLPRGTVLRYTAFINRGVVNSIEDLPGGGRLPYHHSAGGGR